MKSLLVTGGAGFIGSNFIVFMLQKYKSIHIVNLDALTYAGNLSNLEQISQDTRYSFAKGSIGDQQLVSDLFSEYQIDTVVNFAAESHVDRSIVEPELFLETNILGTHTLLENARDNWSNDPGNKHCQEYQEGVKFVQISTDEVYGSLGDKGMFTESTPLAPNSPYSASKASADLIVRAYHKTYGLPVNITRCSNNHGPYQFPEKLIPLMINNCLHGDKLPVYGDGLNVRDWLYVDDHCSAIDAVISNGVVGEVYNIGGNNEKSNIEIVRMIIKALGRDDSLIDYITDRPGHDRRYAINSSKITTELGWSPAFPFETAINKTIEWYLENQTWVEQVTSGEYRSYYSRYYFE